MNYYFVLALLIFVYMSGWFLVSVIYKRNDVADIAWGLGFILLAWMSLFVSNTYSIRGVLVSALVSIWGVRLAWHIYKRNKGKPEDERYKNWRSEWKTWFYLRSYLQIFLLQGVFLFCIIQPVLAINRAAGRGISYLDIIGIAVWIFGFLFESISDNQLARFIHDPANKGKIMQQGLWRYSRHPNYFGEVTQWWGIYICALSVPFGIFTLIGPLTITCLILFVSGVPLLEKKYAGRPDFEEYKKQTSIFFPLPQKR